MAFTVQDDTGGVIGANAYVEVSYFQEYCEDRAYSIPPAATGAQIQAAIIAATSYLDGRFQFIGWRQQLNLESTQWPRYNAVDNDYAYVQGIPREVKHATCEYAARALIGVLAGATAGTGSLAPDPTVSDTGALIEERIDRVGPVEEALRFSGFGHYRFPPYPMADMMLTKRGLVIGGGTIVRGA